MHKLFRVRRVKCKYTLPTAYTFYLHNPIAADTIHTYYDSNHKAWLVQDHRKFTILPRYSWDGCTPQYMVSINLGILKRPTFMVGTWEGKRLSGSLCGYTQLKYPSLVHDVLCQFREEVLAVNPNMESRDIELLFYAQIVSTTSFSPVLAKLYYWATSLNRIFNSLRKK